MSTMASASSLGFDCVAGIFIFKPLPACGANGCGTKWLFVKATSPLVTRSGFHGGVVNILNHWCFCHCSKCNVNTKRIPVFLSVIFLHSFPQRRFILAFLHPLLRFAYSALSLMSNNLQARSKQGYLDYTFPHPLWGGLLHLHWALVHFWNRPCRFMFSEMDLSCIHQNPSEKQTCQQGKWRLWGRLFQTSTRQFLTKPLKSTQFLFQVWDTVRLSSLPLLFLSTPPSNEVRNVSTTLKMPSDFSAIFVLNLEQAKSSWTQDGSARTYISFCLRNSYRFLFYPLDCLEFARNYFPHLTSIEGQPLDSPDTLPKSKSCVRSSYHYPGHTSPGRAVCQCFYAITLYITVSGVKQKSHLNPKCMHLITGIVYTINWNERGDSQRVRMVGGGGCSCYRDLLWQYKS